MGKMMEALMGLPPPPPPEYTNIPETSLAMFLAKNPYLHVIKAWRDDRGGIFKWIDIAVVGYLIFSPCLALIPRMKERWVVIVLWIIIGLLMLFKLDYAHQAEAWWICLCRGIIMDMPKTDTARKWVFTRPVLFALLFMAIFFVVSYIGLDPGLKFRDFANVWTAALAVFGLLFILRLMREVVVVEGDTGTLSVNMCMFLFCDPTFLADKGFHVVHMSQLLHYAKKHGGTCKDPSQFSWDEIHKLPREPIGHDGGICCTDPFAGVKLIRFFKPLKDHGDPEPLQNHGVPEATPVAEPATNQEDPERL